MFKLITLAEFRNYEWRSVEFTEGVNAVIAGNGRGKTNLLEGLFLLLEGRSMKGAEAKEMIKEGQEKAILSGTVDVGREISLRMGIEEDGLIGVKRKPQDLGAVCFQPDDIWMVKGGPEARRKQLDEIIIGLKKGYREVLKEYGRVLRQRNEAIKAVRKGARGREYIRNWNYLLIDAGREIVAERRETTQKMTQAMTAIGRGWGLPELGIKYYSTIGDEDDGEEKVMKKMERLEEAEIRRGSSLIGPHRDEVLFSLGGKNVRRQSSQGEQKLVIILWRLAQGRLIEGERAKEILLLMDDCLSELDAANRRVVVDELREWKQAVVTTTDDIPELAGSNKIWLDLVTQRPQDGGDLA